MHSFHLANSPSCPTCKRVVDGATNPTGDNRPSPGDFTLCVYCLAVLMFTEDLGLRLATQEEMNTLRNTQPQQWNVLDAMAEYLKKHPIL